MNGRNWRSIVIRSRLLFLCKLCLLLSCILAGAWAQTPIADQTQLLQQMEEMKRQLAATQEQLNTYHAQMEELERKVTSLQQDLVTARSEGATAASAAKLATAVQNLQEEQEVQQAEIQVHEQTKVETVSRFPLKVSGLVLFNANSIDGAVNGTTIPVIALSRTSGTANGSLSATMSQTLLGIEGRGPEVWGAHTYGDLQVDFFSEGYTSGGYTPSGRLRLRTADVQFLWPATRVQAGVSRLIFSPTEPTSFLSVAEPAMSWSGNLWAWIPQLSVGHTFSVGGQRQVAVDGALLDVPDASTTYTYSPVSAAEHSRYPGTALHASFNWNTAEKNSIGIGGYWSPHSYGSSGHADGQAIIGDWKFSLPARFAFSGQAYHGAALGGLNEGNYKDVVPVSVSDEYGTTSTTYHGFRDQGGWSQLSWNTGNRLGFDMAFGLDGGNTNQLRHSDYGKSNSYQGLIRNQTWLANVIYHPHSSIILSLEYRRLYSWQITGGKNQAQIFGMAAGYQF